MENYQQHNTRLHHIELANASAIPEDYRHHVEDHFQLDQPNAHAISSSSNNKSDQFTMEHFGNSAVFTKTEQPNQGSSSSSSVHCADIWQMASPAEMAAKLALMTQAPRICLELRNEGVLPLLVQLLHQHSTEDGMLAINNNSALESGQQYPQPTSETFRNTLALRRNSAKALRNIVTHTSTNRKEVELLCLLEDLRSFVEIFYLRWSDSPVEAVDHPCSQLAELFTFACDANYRKTIELYGGVYVISDVIQSDFRFHRAGTNTSEQCFLLRQYSLNVLTYMTAQNETVKSVLGSMRPFIGMLVETLQQQGPQTAAQLQEHNNNHLQLLQSVANVLHNLSWKSDFNSKQIMRDFGTVHHLAKMTMETKDLKTLKSLLEPLLNLTAHCTPNKIDFCKVEGMLDFLISKLRSTTNTSLSSSVSSSASQLSPTELAIVENSGGILRNISSYLVTREDLIEKLRSQNIVAILLEQLKAASLAVVSNACITLSYLAARSLQDALKIKELGGIQILHGLTNSKHEPIKLGASKTLQHLFTSHLNNYNGSFKDTLKMSTSCSIPSSLQMRKLKAFRTEIHSFLSENFDTLQCDASPNGSPSHCSLHNRNPNSKAFNLNDHSTEPNHYPPVNYKVTRSSSHDSIGSTQSEPVNKSSMHHHHPNHHHHHHRRSMHQSSATADDHKSAAAAALLNLTSKNSPNSAAYDHQRMIHSYSGQTLNSCLYATLPASARISAIDDGNGDYLAMVESVMMGSAAGGGDAASDYDISLCDISGSSLACLAPLPPQKGQTQISGSTTTKTNNNNSSSTPDYMEEEEQELEEGEEDPAPTDYSQRFKELVIDDFAPPQSASKSDASAGEDTVKVYQTENTPLAFSLAPSLSDLRETALFERFGSLQLNSSKSMQDDKLFKKPSFLTPKPLPIKFASSSSSTSYNCSKIPYSIKEDVATDYEGEYASERQNQPKSRTGIAKSISSHESLKYCGPVKKDGEYTVRSSSMSAIAYSRASPANNVISSNSVTRQADSLEHFAAKDNAQHFATEDTPAVFSHATSLSSLSIDGDDDLDADFGNSGQQKQKQKQKQKTSVESNATSQTGSENVTSKSSLNSATAAIHQKISQPGNNNNSSNATTQQKNSTLAPVQLQSNQSPLHKMSLSVSTTTCAALVKATPVAAAKRASKTETTQHMSMSTMGRPAQQQYSSEKQQQQQQYPSMLPPKKPLPSIPAGESPLLPKSTSALPIDDEDDDYDDFLFKCRQVVMPKETQVKLKMPAKITSTAKVTASQNDAKQSSANYKNTRGQPISSVHQTGISSQINLKQSPNTRNAGKVDAKSKNNSSSGVLKNTIPNAKQPKQQSSKASNTIKNAVAELSDTDEDDDLLLNQCMQIAINKQSHSHSKSSSKKANVRHSNSSNREGKSPWQINKKNAPSATVSEKISQHHIAQEIIKLPPNEPSPVEREKHFHVEDTPVHFSQRHSPLSLLLVDSDIENENDKLIEAAAQLDAASQEKTQIWVHHTSRQQEMSETESESATVTLTSNNAAAAANSTSQSSSSTHVRSSGKATQARSSSSTSSLEQQRQILPGITCQRGNSTKQNTNAGNDNARNQQRPSVTSHTNKNSSIKARRKKTDIFAEQANNLTGSGSGGNTSHRTPDTGDSSSKQQQHFSSLKNAADDDDDDERTYTICTQSSRHSSATLTAAALTSNQPAPLVMSTYSSSSPSGSVTNIEGENPPSLVYDHNLMFSSTETNMTRSGLKFIPLAQPTTTATSAPRATSARTRRTTAAGGALGHELQVSAYGHPPNVSLEELAHNSAASLLENQKPPSIMEHSSFMSQSTASITSEISDIALDQVPIRQASTDLVVAEVASNYAKEISNLAEQALCFTSPGTLQTMSLDETPLSLSPLSSPTADNSNSKRLAEIKPTNPNDLHHQFEQQQFRSDRTFDMEPSPTPRTATQNSSHRTSTTNTGTTTVTVERTSSNTRTYNKKDRTKGTNNTTEQTLKSSGSNTGKGVNAANADDSDTDISENLPLDDVQTKELNFYVSSPTTTKSFPSQQQFLPNNPIDSSKARNKKPPPAPRYKSRSAKHQHVPASFELTDDDDSSDDDDRLHFGYSRSLNSKRVTRSLRKNSKTSEPVGFPRFESFSSAMRPENQQTDPYSNHHQMAFSSLGRRSYSSSRTKKEKDFGDKDLFFTAKHKNTVAENHAQFFQSKSNTPQSGVTSASKYFDRHAAVLGSMENENHFQIENQAPNAIESAIPTLIPTSKRSNSSDIRKPKENNKSSNKEKKKESSIFSKISSSFSSHNIGSHSVNSGESTPTTPTTPTSTKTSFNKINSKFALLFKRSKSSHDKLDQEALPANSPKNTKTSKTDKNRSDNKTDKVSDSNQNQAGLPRSSTYEKLPVNEEEAAQLSSRQLKNNSSSNNNNTNNTDCQFVVQERGFAEKHFYRFTVSPVNSQLSLTENTSLFGNSSKQTEMSPTQQPPNQFTFTTFVKAPSSKICSSSGESVSTQALAENQLRREADPVYQHQYSQQPKQQQKNATLNSDIVRVSSDQIAAAASVDPLAEANTSTISLVDSSSKQQSRKTCLVTIV